MMWFVVICRYNFDGGDIVANKPYNFRLSPEVNEHLDFLSRVTGMTRTSLITSWIELEYDRYNGNPELRKLLAQMKDMEAQMKGMLGQMNDTCENAPESAFSPELGSCSECVNPCKDEIDPSEVGLCERFKAQK